MGICQEAPSQYLKRRYARLVEERGLDTAEIERLVRERSEARAAKDYARGDALRKQLLELKIEVKDTAAGSTWKPLT